MNAKYGLSRVLNRVAKEHPYRPSDHMPNIYTDMGVPSTSADRYTEAR